jgi:GT2 family glycosyltransferase
MEFLVGRKFSTEKICAAYYVYKVDSDFVLDPNVIEQCVSEIENDFDAIVVHNTPDEKVSWIAKIRKFEVDMYKYQISHSSARFFKKSIYEIIGGFNEQIIAGEDYDIQNRLNRSSYKTGFIHAEALHLGEPKKFWPHMYKYYQYGKDSLNFKKVNEEEFRGQMYKTVKLFTRNWKKLIFHPLKSFLFVIYSILKFGAGGVGLLSGLIKKKLYERK